MAVNALFQSLYSHDTELKDILAKQETARQKAAKLLYIECAVLTLVLIGELIALLYWGASFELCCLAIGIPALFYSYFFTNARSKVNKVYKEEVMPLMLNNLLSHYKKTDDDVINYQPDYDADISLYDSNPLFASGNNITSEDLITGKIDKTQFSFYEVHYWEKTGSGKNSHTYERFQGMAFIADFNKDFEGYTTISKGKPDGLSFFNSFNDLQEVKMEAGDFSNLFNVYSTDQQNARYIITPAFMERVVKLHELTRKMRSGFSLSSLTGSRGNELSVLFRGSNMEVYLPSTKDRFEASVSSEMKVDEISEDFEVLETLLGFIDFMKLNTRIWTKQ